MIKLQKANMVYFVQYPTKLKFEKVLTAPSKNKFLKIELFSKIPNFKATYKLQKQKKLSKKGLIERVSMMC